MMFASGQLTAAERAQAQEDERRRHSAKRGAERVPQSFSASGKLSLGDTVVVRHVGMGVVLASDIFTGADDGHAFAQSCGRGKAEEEEVEEEEDSRVEVEHEQPTAQAAFVLVRVGVDRKTSKDVRFGEAFKLQCNPSLLVDERTNMLNAPYFLKVERASYGSQEVKVCMTRDASDAATHFVAAPASCAVSSDPHSRDMVRAKGTSVRAWEKLALKHCMSGLPLGVAGAATGRGRFALCAGGDKRGDFVWQLETAQCVEASEDLRELPERITEPRQLLVHIKRILCERGGGMYGIRGMSRQFRLMDTSKDGRLDVGEIGRGLAKFTEIHLDEEQLRGLMEHLDCNGDGSISLGEFLLALRGPLKKRRLKVILMAYNVLDIDKSGTVTLDELVGFYDTSFHPDVVDGRKTHEEVMKEFVAQWDNGGGNNGDGDVAGDGIISKEEFVHYYRDVSASIDDDDYFDLMMFNAWHISSGEGWCENTSNIRVLVTFKNGTQQVVGLENDFGVSRQDLPAIRACLRKQGVTDISSVSLSL